MTRWPWIKTPRPNLALGMQQFLSSYARWHGLRHRRVGHLFQGRYRAEMVEDEAYYWVVSRYIHLNPVERDWSTSRPHGNRRAIPVMSDAPVSPALGGLRRLLSARRGARGGSDASSAYRHFVQAGLRNPPPSPLREAFGGWVLGSERFLERLRELAGPVVCDPPTPEARQLAGRDAEAIFRAVSEHYGLDRSALAQRRDPHIARAVAAWLCRRHSEVPLRELAPPWPVSCRQRSQPDPPHGRSPATHPKLADELQQIMARIEPGTKNQV